MKEEDKSPVKIDQGNYGSDPTGVDNVVVGPSNNFKQFEFLANHDFKKIAPFCLILSELLSSRTSNWKKV